MAYHRAILLSACIATLQQSDVTSASASPESEQVPCIGSKVIGDTVGIATDRKTGAREQTLVEARLAVVAHGTVIGTVYIDDQGMRYLEIKRGTVIPGVTNRKQDGSVQPLPVQQVFGGEARLRACRAAS
jgi:hypothetical protein